MARNGSGVYEFPANTDAVTGETISSSKYNTRLNDIETDLNTARPIVAGGTGATSAADARTNLGAQVQGDLLDDIAALSDPDADRILFWDDSDGAVEFLAPGRGLEISGNTLQRSGDTLVKKHYLDGSGGVTTQSTTEVNMSDELLFTPVSDTSVFHVRFFGNCSLYRDTSAADDVRAYFLLSYYDTSAGAWDDFDTLWIGSLNQSTTAIIYAPITFNRRIGRSIVADGDPATQVRLRLRGYLSYAGTEIFMYPAHFVVDEYEEAS